MDRKWKVIAKYSGIICAFAVIVMLGFWQYQQERLAETLSEKIIRFHVRANSDMPKDQELKLQVRDAIGAYMQQELDGVSDITESRRILLADLEQIEARAKEVIQKQGYAYDVTATLTRVEFPDKVYGDYAFPAGEYEALQVIIGAGQGQNWWCVMYPNMCFRGSVYEVVDEDAEESLREVLTAEEYDAVMKSGNFHVKFKWLSFLNTFLN